MRSYFEFILILCLWSGSSITRTQSNGADNRLATSGKKPELAKLTPLDKDRITVMGVWRPDNPTKNNEPIEAVTELSCFRYGGRDLVGTQAFCLQATAMIASKTDGMLYVSTEWLKVVQWDKAQIIATDDSSICVTSQTVFDLQRKTVIALDVRKPEAQGLNGACNLVPDRQTYYLQDVPDYYASKLVSQ